VTSPTPRWLPWRQAMEQALYGPGGFFLRERPAGHFRTSVHASPRYAEAVAELLCRVDAALSRPADLAFVDMAAGGGELCAGVLGAVPAGVAARLRPYAVELAPRPAGLDPRITWTAQPPRGVRGLLFANEWLDNVPLDVAEAGEDGVPRYVEVRPEDGTERLGRRVVGPDAQWLRWWWPMGPQGAAGGARDEAAAPGEAGGGSPGTCGVTGTGAAAPGGEDEVEEAAPDGTQAWFAPGARAEVGRTRDEAWAAAVGTIAAGLAVTADYCHVRGTRPPYGTLTGYREGRQVPPVPDGTCDLTAHVAADSLPGALLVPQRTALPALGLTAGRPPLALASTDPAGYVRALAAASEAASLTAPGGLGDFTWALTPVTAECAQVAAELGAR
jgi:SAM-dependent MidA family methyltransferase